MGRLGLAFRCFFRILGGRPLPEELLTRGAPPALPPRREQGHAALQLLTLLQQEGRLLDFLKEEIASYDDAQIGAAVRNIHRQCRDVLEQHLGLEPVLAGEEESPVTVEEGFDPSRIRLIGNVTGAPPFSGVLRHHGWRATRVELPERMGGDPSVIAPAEVELP